MVSLTRRRLLTATGLGMAASTFGGCSSRKERKPGQVVMLGAYENNPGEPIDLAMKEWARLLEEQSNGEMTMDLYASSQLGSKSDLIDQMIAGAPVITLADGAFYADQGVADFGIVFAPFLFDDWDECWKLTKSDWYAEQARKLDETGLHLITSNWKYGDRHTLLNKKIDSVEGLKGLKIRVPNNVIQVKGFEALGATPTPMALGDVYTSLQQGTIDGLENPLPVLANGKFQEVAKYLILDGHVKNFTSWITGSETYQRLSQAQRDLLTKTGDEAGVFNNQIQDKKADEALAAMKADGVQVLDLDLEGFKKKAMTFYEMPQIKKLWTPGLYETVKEAMK